jgi:predicted MPP superfamily phosphohydrolase
MFWLWLALAIGVLCAVWGIGIERQLFKVRFESLKVLPKGSTTLRVLHVSDFHLAPWQHRKARFISDLINLKPDLVVNTGDNLGHKDAIRPLLAAIKPLLSVPGVFVNGSNDYHSPTARNPFSYLFKPSAPTHHDTIATELMTDVFETSGWLNLNNQDGRLNLHGLELGFIGLDDPHDGLARPETLPAQAGRVSRSDFVIGVSHAPYLNVLEGFATNSAKLAFAGHTHGGQVCLPFKGALVTNCDLPTKNAKGLSQWEFNGNQMWLNVCAGLGTSIFAPVRFFCRPEVRLLTLLPKD